MDEHGGNSLRESLPAYALGALDDDERRRVEAHLADNPDYDDDLAAYRDVTALLALATPPVAPPPAIKDTLMARIDALEATRAGDVGRGALADARVAAQSPVPLRRGDISPVVAVNWRFRRTWLAVAAALLVALLGWNAVLQWQLRSQRQQNETLTAQAEETAAYERLLNDPKAAHVVIGSGPGRFNLPPAGYIYTDPQSNVAVMLTYWLPPLNPGQQYQLWLIAPDGTRDSGGVFTDDGKGNAHVLIHAPANFAKYQSVGVTIEPAGGSPGPTSPRIMGGDIR